MLIVAVVGVLWSGGCEAVDAVVAVSRVAVVVQEPAMVEVVVVIMMIMMIMMANAWRQSRAPTNVHTSRYAIHWVRGCTGRGIVLLSGFPVDEHEDDVERMYFLLCEHVGVCVTQNCEAGK
jgi:hypothetical protein